MLEALLPRRAAEALPTTPVACSCARFSSAAIDTCSDHLLVHPSARDARQATMFHLCLGAWIFCHRAPDLVPLLAARVHRAGWPLLSADCFVHFCKVALTNREMTRASREVYSSDEFKREMATKQRQTSEAEHCCILLARKPPSTRRGTGHWVNCLTSRVDANHHPFSAWTRLCRLWLVRIAWRGLDTGTPPRWQDTRIP